MPSNQPVLLRCKEHGVPLALVSWPETNADIIAVCPVCGYGAQYKEVRQNSAGLIGGVLTEEQLIDLREKMRVADKKGG